MPHAAAQAAPSTPAAAQAAPPTGASTWEATYPGTPSQLARLRADLRLLLADGPLADDVLILASELAANAVTHSDSRRPGGTFTVRLEHQHGSHVRAEVTDQGSSWDGDLTAAAGRPHGLYLLRALSTCCGVRGGAPARTVWFRIDYPA